MGEAIYTLKARFKSEKAAVKGAEDLKTFLREVGKAYSFWQANRNPSMTAKEFWKKFKKDFPQVHEFLGTFGKADIDDFYNGLAGQMSLVGVPEDIEEIVVFNGQSVRYSSEVWHFAEWGPFQLFVSNKFGATDTEVKQR